MTDHPSTYRAEDTHRPGVQWDDRATLHRTGDGDGVFDAAKGLRRGTFAELIGQMMAMPPENRAEYYIEKAGDRDYHAEEIAELAGRSDYPGG
ncbi:MAG: hypothetical protein JY451_02975 [Erythrobacter sp.]|nr:MAG: hypothetical protein JY451_02975 [Erythrobacter sp.]